MVECQHRADKACKQLSSSLCLLPYLSFSFSSHLIVLVEMSRVHEVGSSEEVGAWGEGKFVRGGRLVRELLGSEVGVLPFKAGSRS